jgi:hypothetical protein
VRVSVKSASAVDPNTFEYAGAAYTDNPKAFIDWMEKNCPSSACYIDRGPRGDPVWTYYMRFSLAVPAERAAFIARWGDHKEMPVRIYIG